MFWTIVASTLGTSFISGILGMAGGMVLMGVVSLLLPVTSAMILHGVTQTASNGCRAFLVRGHIRWRVLPAYVAGAAAGFSVFSAMAFVPSKRFVLMTVGLFPVIALLMPRSIAVDILKRRNAFLCGAVVTSAQILAGASGPILDVFFIKSSMNRYEIIATKAITQAIGHIIKLVYYGLILAGGRDEGLAFHYSLLVVAVLCAFTGARLGKIVLDRLSELQFRKYSKAVIAVIGLFYFTRGLLGRF